MPLKKARKETKKAVGKTASKNISELVAANKKKSPSKKRPMKQIVAIAYSAARGGKKRTKK